MLAKLHCIELYFQNLTLCQGSRSLFLGSRSYALSYCAELAFFHWRGRAKGESSPVTFSFVGRSDWPIAALGLHFDLRLNLISLPPGLIGFLFPSFSFRLFLVLVHRERLIDAKHGRPQIPQLMMDRYRTFMHICGISHSIGARGVRLLLVKVVQGWARKDARD